MSRYNLLVVFIDTWRKICKTFIVFVIPLIVRIGFREPTHITGSYFKWIDRARVIDLFHNNTLKNDNDPNHRSLS
jgi:hypothetical protein